MTAAVFPNPTPMDEIRLPSNEGKEGLLFSIWRGVSNASILQPPFGDSHYDWLFSRGDF